MSCSRLAATLACLLVVLAASIAVAQEPPAARAEASKPASPSKEAEAQDPADDEPHEDSAEPTESEASEEEGSDDSEPGHGMPIATLRSTYYGFAELEDPMPGTFEEELEGSMLLTSFKGVFPIPFADKTIVLVPAIFFDHTHLEYRNWDFGVTPASEQLDNFYATGVEMSVINELSERVWFVSRLTWGIYSDLEEVDSSDARLYGVLMADVLVAEDMIVGLGLSYNSDFGFPAPIPFVHFAYRNDWFRTDITIPSDAQAYFLPHERVEIGARARLLGNEYRMTYDDPDWNDMLVQLSTLELGGIGAVRVYRGLWLELGGGAAVRNRYKAILPNGDVLREINFAPTWFANAALIYRI